MIAETAAKGFRLGVPFSALLCVLLSACVMTSPRAPIDTREYTVESALFPTRDATGDPIEVREPTVRPGRLKVVIDGVDEELETLTATPPGTGPFPLALISHGIPAKDLVARNKRLRSFLPLAESFARRGYYAVVFARRGFGSSTGTVVGRPRLWCGHWPSGAYARAARALADEYAAVMASDAPKSMARRLTRSVNP